MTIQEIRSHNIPIKIIILKLGWSKQKLYDKIDKGLSELDKTSIYEVIEYFKNREVYTFFENLQNQSLRFKKIKKDNKNLCLSRMGFSTQEQFDIIG